jgi:universal stress protein A
MSAYKTILLATDLIPPDDLAISQKAAEIAKGSNADLYIVHVVEHPYYFGIPYENPTLMVWQEDMEKTLKERFNTFSQTLDIPEERRFFVIGQAKNKILEVAGKIHADLIVLGTHGRHGIGLFLMGSTAIAILHGIHCDVLAVRVPSTPP